MTKVIRWGVLGAANFAATVMAPAIHEAEHAELVALGTSSPDKAARFKAFCPSLRVQSYEDLLASDDIDAVYIPLPNNMHVEWAKKAIAAGKHVLAEKPIAMQAEEIDELIELRDKSGLLVAEAYMIVHHPQWIRAKELLAEGAVGKLRHVDVAFSFHLLDQGNIRNQAGAGGGSLRDIGVYTMGSTLWATGEDPRIVQCRIIWENGIDATAYTVAQFPSFSYQAMTSMRMCPRQEVVFHGDKAVLRVTAPFNAAFFGEEKLVLERDDKTIEQFRFPGTRQYKIQVENFGRSLRDGSAYAWPLEQARRVQSMMDRAYQAAG
jgi:predicted dehydrogenase